MSNPDRFNVIAICLPLLASTLLCSGCEDSSAARQAEVHAKLTEVSKSLWESPVIMSATTDQAPADAERKLNDLLTILNDTDGAAPGQQSAASLLASKVHRRIADLTLTETAKLEADQRSRRDTLFGLIDAAGQLSAVAGSLETIDTQTQQQHLAANRQSAQARLAAYGEQMAAADAPIAALTSANRADQEQIDQLRAQSNELMREANDLGRAAGYGAYEQSVQLDRDADRVQYDVSQRDLELEFSLRPEQALAQKQADQTQEMIAAIDGSSAAIEGLAQTFGDQARSSRATISQLRQTIVAELDELSGTRTDELQSLYKKAAMQLEAAAQEAEKAARNGRSEQAHAGRVGAARASQELGQMHWSAAMAWQDHIRLLERIEASSGALESASMVSTQLNAARTARSDARREAEKAYTNAHEQLDQITGRAAGPQLETLKQNVQRAISALSGRPVDLTAAPTAPTRSRAGRSSGSSQIGAGADSPQALVTAINQADDLESAGNLFLELTYISFNTASEREMHSIIAGAMRASLDLERALQEKFGTGLMEFGQQGLGGAGMFDQTSGFGLGAPGQDAKLGDVAGDHGTILVTSANQTEPMPIIRVNGRWFLDGSTDAGEMPGIGGEGNEEMEAFAAAMMEMMTTVMQEAIGSYNELTRRVRAGDFASIDDVLQAVAELEQQMQQRMMGGGG